MKTACIIAFLIEAAVALRAPKRLSAKTALKVAGGAVLLAAAAKIMPPAKTQPVTDALTTNRFRARVDLHDNLSTLQGQAEILKAFKGSSAPPERILPFGMEHDDTDSLSRLLVHPLHDLIGLGSSYADYISELSTISKSDLKKRDEASRGEIEAAINVTKESLASLKNHLADLKLEKSAPRLTLTEYTPSKRFKEKYNELTRLGSSDLALSDTLKFYIENADAMLAIEKDVIDTLKSNNIDIPENFKTDLNQSWESQRSSPEELKLKATQMAKRRKELIQIVKVAKIDQKSKNRLTTKLQNKTFKRYLKHSANLYGRIFVEELAKRKGWFF